MRSFAFAAKGMALNLHHGLLTPARSERAPKAIVLMAP